MSKRRVAVACGLTAFSIFFGAAIAAERVPSGIWGGDRVQLNVTEQGGTTEYDCAHGTIDQPLEIDRNGRFAATGTHVFEHAGPVRSDEPVDSHPAKYEGRIAGDRLALTVTLTDTHDDVGMFSLRRDVAPRLHKCM